MLITFEGLDGCGKSTQAVLLRDSLASEGHDVRLFREPGGTELSEQIRDILLHASHDVDPFAEMLLFSAARAQLVAERIQPLIDGGAVVICDRFFDSTTAYQGAGRELAEFEWLDGFHRRVTSNLVPDRTYLLRLPVSDAIARRTGQEEDRMERSGRAFYERVAGAYERLAVNEPERFVVVDALLPIAEIHDRIRADLAKRFGSGTAPRRSGTSGKSIPTAE